MSEYQASPESAANNVNTSGPDADDPVEDSIDAPNVTPNLDGIATAFDEIEGALRRLDDGTYFSDGERGPDASPDQSEDQPAG